MRKFTAWIGEVWFHKGDLLQILFDVHYGQAAVAI